MKAERDNLSQAKASQGCINDEGGRAENELPLDSHPQLMGAFLEFLGVGPPWVGKRDLCSYAWSGPALARNPPAARSIRRPRAR